MRTHQCCKPFNDARQSSNTNIATCGRKKSARWTRTNSYGYLRLCKCRWSRGYARCRRRWTTYSLSNPDACRRCYVLSHRGQKT